MRITDPDDPRIGAYRHIRERDLVGRDGLFIAEGEVVLRVLLAGTLHEPVSLLIAEKRLAALAPMIEGLPPDVPVYTATQSVMDLIAGFPIHRGILALGRRRALPNASALLAAAGPQAIAVVLFGIANHDNMGGIFRNAAAFGANAVLLHGDCCDPLYRKAIRVSVGAALTVPFAYLSADVDAVDLLAEHGFTPLALSPAGGRPLGAVAAGGRVAVLLGAEGEGLPGAILARVPSVRIEMAGTLDSLNVATASGIVLHHLAFEAASFGRH